MDTLDLAKSLDFAQTKLTELRESVTNNPAYVSAAEKATAHIESARAALASGTADVSKHVQSASLALSSFADDATTALSARASKAFASAKQALVDATNAITKFADDAVKMALRSLSDIDTRYQLQDKIVSTATSLDSKFNIVSTAKALDEKYSILSTATSLATKATAMGDSLTGARVTPAIEYISTKAYAVGDSLQNEYIAVKNEEKIEKAE